MTTLALQSHPQAPQQLQYDMYMQSSRARHECQKKENQDAKQKYLVAYFRAGISNQPTRRGRPVVVPYSLPTSRNVSAASPKSSVGYGPAPTLVVYAFACIAPKTIMPVVNRPYAAIGV